MKKNKVFVYFFIMFSLATTAYSTQKNPDLMDFTCAATTVPFYTAFVGAKLASMVFYPLVVSGVFTSGISENCQRSGSPELVSAANYALKEGGEYIDFCTEELRELWRKI